MDPKASIPGGPWPGLFGGREPPVPDHSFKPLLANCLKIVQPEPACNRCADRRLRDHAQSGLRPLDASTYLDATRSEIVALGTRLCRRPGVATAAPRTVALAPCVLLSKIAAHYFWGSATGVGKMGKSFLFCARWCSFTEFRLATLGIVSYRKQGCGTLFAISSRFQDLGPSRAPG